MSSPLDELRREANQVEAGASDLSRLIWWLACATIVVAAFGVGFGLRSGWNVWASLEALALIAAVVLLVRSQRSLRAIRRHNALDGTQPRGNVTTMSKQGGEWRLICGGAADELPAGVPDVIEPGGAVGGVVVRFYDRAGVELAQVARPGELWLSALHADDVVEILKGHGQVVAVAFDGDEGKRIACLKI